MSFGKYSLEITVISLVHDKIIKNNSSNYNYGG